MCVGGGCAEKSEDLPHFSGGGGSPSAAAEKRGSFPSWGLHPLACQPARQGNSHPGHGLAPAPPPVPEGFPPRRGAEAAGGSAPVPRQGRDHFRVGDVTAGLPFPARPRPALSPIGQPPLDGRPGSGCKTARGPSVQTRRRKAAAKPNAQAGRGGYGEGEQLCSLPSDPVVGSIIPDRSKARLPANGFHLDPYRCQTALSLF